MNIFIGESGIEKQANSLLSIIICLQTKKSAFHDTIQSDTDLYRFVLNNLNLDFTLKIAIFGNHHEPKEIIHRVLKHLLEENAQDTIYVDQSNADWHKDYIRDRVNELCPGMIHNETNAGIQLANALAKVIEEFYCKAKNQEVTKIMDELHARKKIDSQFIFGDPLLLP